VSAERSGGKYEAVNGQSRSERKYKAVNVQSRSGWKYKAVNAQSRQKDGIKVEKGAVVGETQVATVGECKDSEAGSSAIKNRDIVVRRNTRASVSRER